MLVNVLCVFAPIVVMAQSATELTNLVLFVRFADDAEIDHSFASIDTMFNGKTPGYLSVYNFYDVMTYGRIHYNTVYTNNVQNGVIISYQDPYPRGYFEPYSPSNPIGYTEPNPFMGVSMREAELLGSIFRMTLLIMNRVSMDKKYIRSISSLRVRILPCSTPLFSVMKWDIRWIFRTFTIICITTRSLLLALGT